MFMVPTRLLPAFSSPLFSWRTKLRMVREWFYRYTPSASESTVADFVRRHYGREMVDRVADPLLAGVYGGSADELSVAAVLPRFVEMEAQHGSLTRGMLASKAKREGSASPSLFTSLKNGMHQMVDALLAQIPESARRVDTPIEAVKPELRKWLAMNSGRTEEFDAVIMALPSHVSARLIGGAAPQLASDLGAIRYSSSVIAVFGYDNKVRAALPPGFGFLVPSAENRRILAATFAHNKFTNRAPEDRAVVRCFLGGTRDEGALQPSDNEIQLMVRQELKELLGITVEPLFARTYRWKSAMAQYEVGHIARVARIRDLVSALPGLALAGNAYSGIGIPDCVRSGSDAATKVVADLRISDQRG
jgi:oxygen-dependent protoporphyrinogen oxidase